MLLKCSQSEKRSRANASSRQQHQNHHPRSSTDSTTTAMKLTLGATLAPRLHRKAVKKTHAHAGEAARVTSVDPCDNSNDSGLGFDNHLEYHLSRSTVRFSDQECAWTDDHPEVKRKKLEIKLESDDANDDFTFPETATRRRRQVDFRGSTVSAGVGEAGRPTAATQRLTEAVARPPQRQGAVSRQPGAAGRRGAGPAALSTQLGGVSGDGKTHLQILCQPEQQHRARYQTEGSRGAVKDRSGNGFPVVKLVGYDRPATLQVFIGTDLGRVAPHMFYQACRVSGKNSTPCVEKKVDGTVVIEVDFDPAKDMVVTCDCVGILKERNVDVEHRFPDQSGARNKKKSTRCRMVFRTTITHDDGSTEILQTTSQPIVCTQPPGVPEICKKSVSACPSSGGLELFILGKNFLKDTRVVFQQSDSEPCWEETVQPDKEYLQQTHLVCVVPPYRRTDIVNPVTVKLMVSSSGKMSEPHTFTYLPTTNPVVATALQVPVGAVETCAALLPPATGSTRVYGKGLPAAVLLQQQRQQKPPPLADASPPPLPAVRPRPGKEAAPLWPDKAKLLPPPPLLPLGAAARAFLKAEDDGPEDLRTKQPQPLAMATVADLSSTRSPSMATFRQFVSDSSFLAQSAHSIEKYLSHIESKQADKIDAILNSAAETHLAKGGLAASVAVKQIMMDTPSTSPMAVKQMMMDATAAAACTSPIAVKQLMMDTPNMTCTSPIAVKQMMMNTPNTTCTSPISVKQMMMDGPTTSPIAVKQMMMDTPTTTCTSPIAVKQMMMDAPNTACTSPIAVKQMMMDAPNTACTSPIAVKQMMMDGPATSPIAVKQMMLDTATTACTSPIAVKQMMMDAPNTACTSPVAVQQMMLESPTTACNTPEAVQQMMMDAPTTACTSPMSVKQMMMDAPTTAGTPPIAVKQIMMDAPTLSPIAVQQIMMEAPATSPIAVKQMMLDTPSTACSSPIAVKQMMMDSPTTVCTSPIAVKQMMMDAPSTACSSPIAVKQMMMDAPTTACTQPISVQQMMMDAPTTSPDAVQQMMMETPATASIAVQQMMMDAPTPSADAVQQMMMESPATSSMAVQQMMMETPATSSMAVQQMMMETPATSSMAVQQMMMESPAATVCTVKTMLLDGAILDPTAPPPPSAEEPAAVRQTAPAPAVPAPAPGAQKKCEEGMLPQELTQMSDNDLISYINPSCFDAV